MDFNEGMQMFERKYDLEAALIIENTVTDQAI
jgi:hypothetical protein